MRKRTLTRGSSNRGRAVDRKRTKGSAHTAESSATVERIIESAHRVLLQVGHAALTTRRVAEAAGMTHGNLNYHFPSKRDLLRALIGHLLKSYAQRFEAFLSDPNYPLGQDLDRLVRWLCTDSIAPDTVRTFRELWALSLQDAEICHAVDDFYDEAIAGVSKILRDARPQADPSAIDLLLHLFAMVSEGGTVLYGTRRERIVPHERILDLIPVLIGVIAPDLQPSVAEPGVHASTRRRSR